MISVWWKRQLKRSWHVDGDGENTLSNTSSTKGWKKKKWHTFIGDEFRSTWDREAISKHFFFIFFFFKRNSLSRLLPLTLLEGWNSVPLFPIFFPLSLQSAFVYCIIASAESCRTPFRDMTDTSKSDRISRPILREPCTPREVPKLVSRSSPGTIRLSPPFYLRHRLASLFKEIRSSECLYREREREREE